MTQTLDEAVREALERARPPREGPVFRPGDDPGEFGRRVAAHVFEEFLRSRERSGDAGACGEGERRGGCLPGGRGSGVRPGMEVMDREFAEMVREALERARPPREGPVFRPGDDPGEFGRRVAAHVFEEFLRSRESSGDAGACGEGERRGGCLPGGRGSGVRPGMEVMDREFAEMVREALERARPPQEGPVFRPGDDPGEFGRRVAAHVFEEFLRSRERSGDAGACGEGERRGGCLPGGRGSGVRPGMEVMDREFAEMVREALERARPPQEGPVFRPGDDPGEFGRRVAAHVFEEFLRSRERSGDASGATSEESLGAGG